MGGPKMTTEYIYGRTTPCCPHCGGYMHGVTISLDALIDRYPLPWHVDIDEDGYGFEDDAAVSVDCPDCFRPSALALDGHRWKLIACRTVKDRAFEQEAALSSAVAT